MSEHPVPAPPRLLRGLAAALLLSGCSGWLGESEEEDIEGERVEILARVGVPDPDPGIADLPVTLPAPTANAGWPQEGGAPGHAMGHLAASGDLAVLWSVGAGAGSRDDSRILAQPVIADGRVHVMDADAAVGAFDAATGAPLWRVGLAREGDDGDGVRGGGIAVADGRIFATTGFGDVVALSAEDGAEAWRSALGAPVRAAPTVRDGRVFVATIADELIALDAASGRELWVHAGLSEVARLLGAAAPAAGAGVVVAPYSSGEVAALRVENGRAVWTESLAGSRRASAVAALAHVRGWPVIDRGVVYAVGHGNRMLAVDLRTGSRLWAAAFGGVQGPWVAGDFLYVMTGDAALVCLARGEGRVRWVRQLPRYRDEEDLEGPIVWTGPVLAGGRLIVAGSEGEILALSPRDGEILLRVPASAPIHVTPAVAGGTLFVLTDDADLIALR